MAIAGRDREVVRGLARRVAEVAADQVNDSRRDLRRRLNGLEPARPPIFTNEIPWREILPAGVLECEAAEDSAP